MFSTTRSAIDWNMIDPKDIPDNVVFSHPLVNELAESASMNEFKYPLVIPNKVLMDEGKWNNHFYSGDAIGKAFKNTDWSDREKKDLFLDHEDRRASEWVGTIANMRMDGGQLLGDIIVHDWPLAMKMSSGKPKFGISPKVKGKTDIKTQEMFEFVFDNFSIVINPAVKTAYINNSEIKDEDGAERLYRDAGAAGSKNTDNMEVSSKMAEEEKTEAAEEEKPAVEEEPKAETPEGEGAEKEEAPTEEKTETPTEEAGEKPKEELAEKIGALESLLSELKAKQEVKEGDAKRDEEMKGLKNTIQKMQATISKLGEVPDKRSVKAEVVDKGVIEIKAKLKEIEKNPDKAMREWLQNTLEDGGYQNE